MHAGPIRGLIRSTRWDYSSFTPLPPSSLLEFDYNTLPPRSFSPGPNMMGLFGQASSHLRGKPRGGSMDDREAIEGSEPDDTSILLVSSFLLSTLSLVV